MFEDWMTKMRAARKVPFGTAYELFAREAWNAAIASEREACAKLAEAHFIHGHSVAGSHFAAALAEKIRMRSNNGKDSLLVDVPDNELPGMWERADFM